MLVERSVYCESASVANDALSDNAEVRSKLPGPAPNKQGAVAAPRLAAVRVAGGDANTLLELRERSLRG